MIYDSVSIFLYTVNVNVHIYFIKMKKNQTKDIAKCSMPKIFVMLMYHVWYRFTYFKQIETMSGEKQ